MKQKNKAKEYNPEKDLSKFLFGDFIPRLNPPEKSLVDWEKSGINDY